jgi:hypothetical protein
MALTVLNAFVCFWAGFTAGQSERDSQIIAGKISLNTTVTSVTNTTVKVKE